MCIRDSACTVPTSGVWNTVEGVDRIDWLSVDSSRWTESTKLELLDQNDGFMTQIDSLTRLDRFQGLVLDEILSLYLSLFSKLVVLLRWQEFATRSVAVFCLTYHRSGSGEYRCSMHHALRVRVNHLSHSLPLTPHHAAHINCRRRC